MRLAARERGDVESREEVAREGQRRTGDFPPSSRVSGVKCFAAAREMIRAMRALPV